jgi:transcriptional regulator with XRE-family HTH domain
MGIIVRGRQVLFWASSKFLDGNTLKTLGDRIRLKRKELGWTQEGLAEFSDLDRSYIGGVERGERNLTFTVLCQICTALGCDVATLTIGLPPIPRK